MLNLDFVNFRYTYLVVFLSDTQSSQVVIGCGMGNTDSCKGSYQKLIAR